MVYETSTHNKKAKPKKVGNLEENSDNKEITDDTNINDDNTPNNDTKESTDNNDGSDNNSNDNIDNEINESNDDDTKDNDNGTPTQYIKHIELIQYMNDTQNRSKHKRQVTVKDAEWVLNRLHSVDFATIDTKGDYKIDFNEFSNYFGRLGFDENRAHMVFQMLDDKDKKQINLIQFNKWKHKQTSKSLHNVLNAFQQ